MTLASGAFIVPPDAAKPVRFSEHVLVNEHRYTLGIAAVDIDGDGRPDLAIVDNR